MNLNRDLTASEALYSFVSWLTCREEEVVLSKYHNAAPIAELVSKFIEANNLPQPGNDWTKLSIKIPGENNEE